MYYHFMCYCLDLKIRGILLFKIIQHFELFKNLLEYTGLCKMLSLSQMCNLIERKKQTQGKGGCE